MAEAAASPRQGGVLGWIERTGNALPDPVFIFVWLIGILVVASVILAAVGLGVDHPVQTNADGTPVRIATVSLIAGENIRRLLVDMPQTFTHFHPLGYVLVVMLGAGVAERTGLFAAAMRAAVRHAPVSLLTPAVALVAMMANLAADAAYVVLIPLAAVLYASAGRHPILGIAASFAGVSGGFSANLLPGQLDALLFGITQAAVDSSDLHAGWTANIAGNWYFMAVMTILFLPVIWFVTDRVIEPRLGAWTGGADAFHRDEHSDGALSDEQKKGLRRAGLAALGVLALWAVFVFAPGTPLIDEDAASDPARLTPLYRSLVAGFFVLFLAAGWAYGAATGSVNGHRDVVKMMSGAMSDLAYYLVLAFAAAHFVAMFGWSNLGLIIAVLGADGIAATGLPLPVLLGLIVLVAAFVNLFVGSASAEWALLAPTFVPMLMLLGVSPEMATAAFRVGDSATNIVTPLMVYFPLILVFAQRWDPEFGLGSLAAMMLPFSIGILVVGTIQTIGWVALDLPLGPGAVVEYALPGVTGPS